MESKVYEVFVFCWLLVVGVGGLGEYFGVCDHFLYVGVVGWCGLCDPFVVSGWC